MELVYLLTNLPIKSLSYVGKYTRTMEYVGYDYVNPSSLSYQPLSLPERLRMISGGPGASAAGSGSLLEGTQNYQSDKLSQPTFWGGIGI